MFPSVLCVNELLPSVSHAVKFSILQYHELSLPLMLSSSEGKARLITDMLSVVAAQIVYGLTARSR